MSLALHYPFYKNPVLTDAVRGVILSCTRATTRSVSDEDGWIREVQANEAAFQGTRFRHNLVPYSQDFDVATTSWTAASSAGSPDPTLDADQTVDDPLGGNAASTVTFGATSGAAADFSILRMPSIADANRHNMMRSIYVRANAAGDVGKKISLYGQSTAVAGAFTLTAEWQRISLYEAAGAGSASFTVGTLGTTYNEGYSQAAVTVDIFGAMQEVVSGRWDSENLLPTSDDIVTDWATSQSTISASTETVPSGYTADAKITDDGISAAGAVFATVNSWPVLTAGVYHYASLVVKSDAVDTQQWITLAPISYGAQSIAGYFDIINGVTGTLTADAVDSGMISLGDGWYRIWIKFWALSSDVTGGCRFYLAEGDNDLTWTDRSTAGTVHINSPQLERVKPLSTAPGTYTETTAAAVTNYSPSDYIATTTVAKSVLTGANDGLVNWESRTNGIIQSEDFTTSWTTAGGGGAVTANQTIAPDGSLTADLLSYSAGAFVVVYQTGRTVTSGVTHCASVFAKADGADWLAISSVAFDTAGNDTTYFDLANGVVGTEGANHGSGIEDYGNGWYRCWVTFSSTTDLSGEIRYITAQADLDQTCIPGDSTFLWGAQLEAGAKPGPYIRTTTGAVTANADDVSVIDVSWLAGAGAAATGTFYSDMTCPSYVTDQNPFSVNSGGSNGYFSPEANTSQARIQAFQTGKDAPVPTVSISPTLSGGDNVKIAFRLKEDDVVIACNGAISTVDTTYDPHTSTRLDLGLAYAGARSFNGLIREIAYWTDEFADPIVQDMSLGNLPGERRVSLTRTVTANLNRNLARNLHN